MHTNQSTSCTSTSFPKVDFPKRRMINTLPTNRSSPAKQRGTSAHIHLTEQPVILPETGSPQVSFLKAVRQKWTTQSTSGAHQPVLCKQKQAQAYKLKMNCSFFGCFKHFRKGFRPSLNRKWTQRLSTKDYPKGNKWMHKILKKKGIFKCLHLLL